MSAVIAPSGDFNNVERRSDTMPVTPVATPPLSPSSNYPALSLHSPSSCADSQLNLAEQTNSSSPLGPLEPQEKSSQPADRKRRLSRSTQESPLRRPRPPPLSSKSSSAIPTLGLSVDPVVTRSPTRPPPSHKSKLGRSITMASQSNSNVNSPAADLLRQAMMSR